MEINRVLIAVISFCIGGIPFGYVIAKIKGLDIRQHGSGNIGATNVYRILGKKYGALTLFLDLSKGVFSVLLAEILFKNDMFVIYISAVFAVLGHDFSIFLRFKGGKGVATTYGVVLPISLVPSLIGMFIWIVILMKTKYSSLAALLSFIVATVVCFLLSSYRYNRYLFVFLLILMLFKHRENIKRFYLKEENRLSI